MNDVMAHCCCVEQKELVLYPNKNGCVRDLLEEARKQVTTSPEVGSGRLRCVMESPAVTAATCIADILVLFLCEIVERFKKAVLRHIRMFCNWFACRLVEIISNKIFTVQKDEAQLECITNTTTKLYRIEEILKDELDLADDELIVQVAHFNKVRLFLSLFMLHIVVLASACICQSLYEVDHCLLSLFI